MKRQREQYSEETGKKLGRNSAALKRGRRDTMKRQERQSTCEEIGENYEERTKDKKEVTGEVLRRDRRGRVP
jgi:hypothetical protein